MHHLIRHKDLRLVEIESLSHADIVKLLWTHHTVDSQKYKIPMNSISKCAANCKHLTQISEEKDAMKLWEGNESIAGLFFTSQQKPKQNSTATTTWPQTQADNQITKRQIKTGDKPQ